MKIAVVGSGIAGLGAALALTPMAEVRVFERQDRVGGHANTVDVRFPDGVQPVDTGFIVYNLKNYPNLGAMFAHLGVPTQWSDMSFGFSLDRGACEYACDNLSTLFAQRWRAADLRFVRMLREILRFNRIAPAELAAGRLRAISLGDWLDERGFSDWFRTRFLLPMGGAIWSTSPPRMLDFPAESFIAFFANHDLLTGLDPAQRWRTVTGGSRSYVRRIEALLRRPVETGRAVVRVQPGAPRPRIGFADGSEETFDHVILACHAPEAVAMIGRGNGGLADALAAFRTTENRAVLHSDPALMPTRRKVWSSWNFLASSRDADRPAAVTYWMNRLQGIPAARPLFVSLNPTQMPDPALTHAEAAYAHPLYDRASFAGQAVLDAHQGQGGVWAAGAWTGYGFHEDGLRSGLRVAAAIGARVPWARDLGRPLGQQHAHAAE